MSEDHCTLYCFIENVNVEAFPVDIDPKKTVGHLQTCIKSVNTPDLNDVNPSNLTLWKVDTPDDRKIDSSGLNDENALKPTRKISNYWNEKTLPENCIHVYIRIRGK